MSFTTMMKRMIGTSRVLFAFLLFSLFVFNLNSIAGPFTELPRITKFARHERVHAPREFIPLVNKVAEKYEVDKDLICAIVKVESNWWVDAIGVNADSVDRGLGQINSKYESWYVEKFGIENYQWDNPEKNLELTANIIKWSSNGFDFMVQGVAAYNCGRSRVKKNKLPETTKKYVEKVMYWYNYYKNHK